ncbi:hypothetical protein [Paenochrobactrum pullorum]|uniref:hypothetical protein n=1 Tax=Paenochrobactrum pullorum TaxID=1324351 RepID=UPI0035BBC2CD
MRFLIGAACVAVIAFVGYYFWDSKNARQEYAASCNSMIQNGAPNETASDKRLAKKRLQDCINFIETGKLP